MGHNQSKSLNPHFYNIWCIKMLENLHYDVPQFVNSIGRVAAHIFLFLFSAGVLIVSWLTVKEIVFFTFGLHFLNLLYTWLTSLIRMQNYNNAYYEKWDVNKTSAINEGRPHSPYHGRFIAVTCILVLLLFMMFLASISIPSIDLSALYSFTTYLSIIVTFLQKCFDGIVLIYSATVKVKQ